MTEIVEVGTVSLTHDGVAPFGITDSKRLTKFKIRLRDKYKLSLKEAVTRLDKSEYQCEICSIEFVDESQLNVDHCHLSGKTRGFLCKNCNMMLGNAHDNIVILERAIKYLQQHGVTKVNLI